MYLKTNAPYSILEKGKELELEELLCSINAIDLLERFKSDGIHVDDLTKLDANDLKFFVPSDRAELLHRNIQKENERKICLQQRLKDVKCYDLYQKLLKIGYTSEKVFSTDHDTLKRIGLSFMERKEVLKKIEIAKNTNTRGNLILLALSIY